MTHPDKPASDTNRSAHEDRVAFTVLVPGGAGFIGRHAVAALLERGCRVIIGTRQPGPKGQRTPPHPAAADAEQREIRLEELLDPDDWAPMLQDVNAVLNCVGILRQRGKETYDKVHRRSPAALAEACRQRSMRFVQVSALSLDHPYRSRFLTSKLAGEHAIREIGGDFVLARPSLLDGKGGFGASWLRWVSQLPVYAVPADALGRIAALDVSELGEALARLAIDDAEALRLEQSRVFELGGTQAWPFADYIGALRRNYTEKPAVRIRIPGLLSRLGAHLCDVFHFSPFSFGHWELLQRDNVPQPNRLPELLGREPISVVARDLKRH